MRAFALLVVVAISLTVLGCGSSEDTNTNLVTVREFLFQPMDTTVPSGTEVQWTNIGSATHSVVSGELLARSIPQTTSITLLQTEFSPVVETLRFGDKIQFISADTLQAQIEVRDQQGNLLFLSPSLNQNDTATWQPTITGRAIITNRQRPSVTTTIDIVGIPEPDGLFDSGVLAPNGRFRFTFNTPGRYPYYCGVHNEEVGVINVSP